MTFELYLLTFNCARNFVDPESLAPSLFDALPKSAFVPDLVAISLQEVAPIAYSFLGGSYLKPYFDRLTTSVQLAAELYSNGSDRLEHLATRSLGMTALMLFAKPGFVDRVQWIQAAGVGVGFWNMGNKGAVSMRLGLSCPGSDETLNLSFTAAHLAPMEWDWEARNKDWENIVRNTVFSNDDDSAFSSSEELPLLSSGDAPSDSSGLFCPGSHLFLAGDLNYRTCDTAPGPRAFQTYPQRPNPGTSAEQFSQLLQNDQLTREREANRTLHGLHELPITFPPTYKYSFRKDGSTQKRSAHNEPEYEWARHRYPSWCDRILFLPSPPSAPRLQPQKYTALSVQPTSDHRPVALSLCVEDRPLPPHAGGIRSRPPFPINPDWKARGDAARRCEVIVGVLSYLALTKKGNAIVVAIAGIVFASWYLTTWLTR